MSACVDDESRPRPSVKILINGEELTSDDSFRESSVSEG